MTTVAGRVIVYGGKGALGSKCVTEFKKNNWWVASVGHKPNEEADFNIVLDSNSPLPKQEELVLNTVGTELNSKKLDSIICVAGGWKGGNAAKNLIANTEAMWQSSVWPSLIAASLATKHLKNGGLLVLTGAKSALNETPKMIGYGVSKSAVHALTRSLAAEDSGMPKDSLTVAILPDTLDTPMNRKWMPNANFSSWTSLDYVSEMFLKWSKGMDRPKNGSLVQLITKDSVNSAVPFTQ